MRRACEIFSLFILSVFVVFPYITPNDFMLRSVCIVFAPMSQNVKYTKPVDMLKYSSKHKGRKNILFRCVIDVDELPKLIKTLFEYLNIHQMQCVT